MDFSSLPKYPETVRNNVNLLREYFRTHLHEPICLGDPFEVFYTPKYWRGPKQFAKISKNTPIDSFWNSTSDSVKTFAKIIHTRPTKSWKFGIFWDILAPDGPSGSSEVVQTLDFRPNVTWINLKYKVLTRKWFKGLQTSLGGPFTCLNIAKFWRSQNLVGIT